MMLPAKRTCPESWNQEYEGEKYDFECHLANHLKDGIALAIINCTNKLLRIYIHVFDAVKANESMNQSSLNLLRTNRF